MLKLNTAFNQLCLAISYLKPECRQGLLFFLWYLNLWHLCIPQWSRLNKRGVSIQLWDRSVQILKERPTTSFCMGHSYCYSSHHPLQHFCCSWHLFLHRKEILSSTGRVSDFRGVFKSSLKPLSPRLFHHIKLPTSISVHHCSSHSSTCQQEAVFRIGQGVHQCYHRSMS